MKGTVVANHDVQWNLLGEAGGGTVSSLAVAPDFARCPLAFAATAVGLYRSTDGGASWEYVESLKSLSLTAVALSVDLDRGGVIMAGSLDHGLYRSIDGGHTWQQGAFQGRRVQITVLALSPDFLHDGVAFAGTMSDGCYRSSDYGKTWEPWNFGLLDMCVLDLAVSPSFSRDQTLFVVTASALFRSQNGGRAWRELTLPPAAIPTQCVAISPDYAHDSMVFVGSETAGVFRSSDRGRTWESQGLPDVCVNALAISPGFVHDHIIVCASEDAIYLSSDTGSNWSRQADLIGTLCLTLAPTFAEGGPALAGLANTGIARSTNALTNWSMSNSGLTAWLLSGLVVVPGSTVQLFAFGNGEGVFAWHNGTWAAIDASLPSTEIYALGGVATAHGGQTLYAALPEGIWSSTNQTGDWTLIGELAAQALAVLPTLVEGPRLIAVGAEALWVSDDGGHSWQAKAAAWDTGPVLALALAPEFAQTQSLAVIFGRDDRSGAAVWQGHLEGEWQCVLVYDEPVRSAALTITSDGLWVAINDQISGPLAILPMRAAGEVSLVDHAILADDPPTVLNLAHVATSGRNLLAAATDGGLFVAIGTPPQWQHVDSPHTIRPLVALAYVDDGLYALEFGGRLWHITLASLG